MFFRYYSWSSSLGFGWGGGLSVSVSVVERNHRQTAGHTHTPVSKNGTFVESSLWDWQGQYGV